MQWQFTQMAIHTKWQSTQNDNPHTVANHTKRQFKQNGNPNTEAIHTQWQSTH